MSDRNNCQSIQIFLDTEIIGATGSSLENWVGVSSRWLCVQVVSLIERPPVHGTWLVNTICSKNVQKQKKMGSRLSLGRACK